MIEAFFNSKFTPTLKRERNFMFHSKIIAQHNFE